MKTISILSILCFIIIMAACKKKEKTEEMVNITGTIYKNCNTVASNTTYYIVYPTSLYGNQAPEELITDAYGMFSYKVKKNANGTLNISPDKNINHYFAYIDYSSDKSSLGIIRENVSNQLVVKLKTNHVLTSLDTIKYVFQYNTVWELINGPITKDTIIGTYTQNLNSVSYNASPNAGELKTLWWNFGQTTSSNQIRVDYTVHGCANAADTAYIVVQ